MTEYYSKEEVNELLQNKALAIHTHSIYESEIQDLKNRLKLLEDEILS